MFSGEQLDDFQKQLLDWFRQFQRDLPWRRTKDAYRIWLSEIMLQQTRVAAVVPYYERFLEQFPDVQTLAEAPPDEVLRLWSGLGYYSRARNLQQAAQQIVGKHEGKFPATIKDILALPGIGAYTSAAILSIAFGDKHAVLDGNVARVLARLAAIRGDLRESGRWQSLQKFAEALLAPQAPGDWNQAMMELGATLCIPKSPQCLLCPVAQFCEARKRGVQEELPERRRKRDTVRVNLAAAVLCDLRGRTILLAPPVRSAKGIAEADDVPTLVSCMWHFPTIAIRKNAASELRNHVKTLVSPTIAKPLQMDELKAVRHAVTYRAVNVHVFRVDVAKLPKIAGARALTFEKLSTLPISNLTRKIANVALSSAKKAGISK